MLPMLLALTAQAGPPSLWSAPVRVRAAAASPDGADLLVALDRYLQVRSPATGAVRSKVRACDHPVAVGFSDTTTAVVVCREEAIALSWPGLEITQLARFDGRVETGAVGPGVFAAGFSDGQLTIHRSPLWKPRTEQTFSDIETLDFDFEGKRLLLANDDRKPLRLYPASGEAQALAPVGDTAVFSPDGSQLFALKGGFSAVLTNPAGAVAATFKTGSWINDAHFLSDTEILAGGSEGLVVYRAGSAKPVETWASGSRWSKLAVGDGWRCAADWTQMQCWGVADDARSAVDPATIAANRPASQPERRPGTTGTAASSKSTSAQRPPPQPASSEPAELNLASRRGDLLITRLTSGSAPAVGTDLTLYKHVTRQLGRTQITAWLNIADVTVAQVQGGTIKLTIVQENSVMTMNGQKVDQFKTGSRLKVE